MSFDRVDLWLTDKVSPIKEKTKAGKDVWKFFGSMQAYAYDYWAGTPKEQRSAPLPLHGARPTRPKGRSCARAYLTPGKAPILGYAGR